jgi:hypothetical protein
MQASGRMPSPLGSFRLHTSFCVILGGVALLAPACSSSRSDGAQKTGSAENAASPAGPDTTSCRVPTGCIRGDRIQVMGPMSYGDSSAPIAYTNPPKYRALRFNGISGDNVDIVVRSQDGDAEAWLLDSEFGILAFNDDDPAGGTTDSHISATLPSTGSVKYYVAFRDKFTRSATFTVNLSGPALTLTTTRIAQTDIDTGNFDSDQLFAYGNFLFNHEFAVEEGFGNALPPGVAGPLPRPNPRITQNGKFGGPDATSFGNAPSCKQCHLVGGNLGGGTLTQNEHQDGDGVNDDTSLLRNPPQLLGDGFIQQIGIEMTQELQGQLASAQSAVAGGAGAQSVSLGSKGVSFGTIVVNADGSVDFSQLDGVDKDLVVKPLGWKGRQAFVRRFVEGSFQVHMGMASTNNVATNCKTPIPGVVGNGADCTDPDADGIKDELLEGQLTSIALFPALLQVPIRINPTDPHALGRVRHGESLFNQVGCTNCHIQNVVLNSPIHNESPDLSGGPPFSVDLTVDGKLPRLRREGDGTVVVELFSDLKRHDMGPLLADKHDFQGGVIPARLFMTRPLWGVGVTAPYLHTGLAPTLLDAISQHAGDAASVHDAFFALDSDSQTQVVEFLQTLQRDPQHTDD